MQQTPRRPCNLQQGFGGQKYQVFDHCITQAMDPYDDLNLMDEVSMEDLPTEGSANAHAIDPHLKINHLYACEC